MQTHTTNTESRITAEARGKLRIFKKSAAGHKAAIERILPTLTEASRELFVRSSLKGRARVFDRVQSRMAPHARLYDVRLEGRCPLALWAHIKPREAVIVDPDEPGQMQDCATIDYVLAGAILGPDSSGWGDGLWGLEVSDHALLRLLTRSPGVDIGAVLFEAHRSLLAMPEAALKMNGDPLLIAAGGGVFICELLHGPDISADDGISMHARAKTWLHNDQLRPDQRPHPAASPGESRLAAGWMRPTPLRDITQDGDRYRVATPEWAAGFGAATAGAQLH